MWTPEANGSRRRIEDCGGHADTRTEPLNWPLIGDIVIDYGGASGTEADDCSGDAMIALAPICLMMTVINLVMLALLEALSAPSIAAWRLLRHEPSRGADGKKDIRVAGSDVRPLPLRIRRRRVSRRRPRGDPAQRIRAACRRVEAYMCIWLTLSNHLLAAQAVRARLGKAGAAAGFGHGDERGQAGAGADPPDGTTVSGFRTQRRRRRGHPSALPAMRPVAGETQTGGRRPPA